jgi:hypothetical protein
MKLVLHFDEGEIRERIWRQSICSYTTNISTPEIRMSVGIERFLFFFRRFGAGFGTRTKKKCPPFQSNPTDEAASVGHISRRVAAGT